ncbi:MAG: GTP pyrophosphokinase [Thermodesulfobacteriota bacterium]
MKYDIENLFEEYSIRKNNAKLLIDEVKHIIYHSLDKENIKIHHVFDRIKGFDSFLAKIRRKELSDPFNQVHDLIGFRIICLFLEDLDIIGYLLMKEFDVFDIEDNIFEKSPEIFGYMDSQYKARLRNVGHNFDTINNYPFEIQIRTISQDAWASISHHLFYKKDIFLPASLQRDFHALSGLFYIADTHFGLLREEQFKYFIEELKKSDEANKYQ